MTNPAEALGWPKKNDEWIHKDGEIVIVTEVDYDEGYRIVDGWEIGTVRYRGKENGMKFVRHRKGFMRDFKLHENKEKD